MRDRLTPPAIRSASSPNAMLPQGRRDSVVDRHYFDRVVSITNSTVVTAKFPGTYGQFPILAPPENVSRSIVTALAVCGSPSAYFRTRFYWIVGLSEGSAQEFAADALSGQGNAVVNPAVLPGLKWVPYGSLDEPQEVRILVKQGAQLQITIYGGNAALNTDTPNVMIRLRGLHEFERLEA
jgi:hypothetical protein